MSRHRNRIDFAFIRDRLMRSKNPVTFHALSLAYENARDSAGADVMITGFGVGDTEITWQKVNADPKNEAFFAVALSTLACYADDTSMFDGYGYTGRQIAGFQRAYNNAVRKS